MLEAMFCFTVTCYVRQQKTIYIYIELCSAVAAARRLLILVKIFLDLPHSIQFVLGFSFDHSQNRKVESRGLNTLFPLPGVFVPVAHKLHVHVRKVHHLRAYNSIRRARNTASMII